MKDNILPILQVGNVLVSSDILTEKFCCDLSACKGICCVEGDAGAPVSLDEIGEIENVLDEVWSDLSASAQAVVDKQGVAYTDPEGDLVTSIVNGKNCVFTCYADLKDQNTGETIHDRIQAKPFTTAACVHLRKPFARAEPVGANPLAARFIPSV